MKKSWSLLAVVFLLAPAMRATSYYVGLEDTIHGDYDYNDLVFSISANNLTLISDGTWYTKPVLGTSGTPFWNRASGDGTNATIGYCMYGGGNCGTGLDPSALYLASSDGKSVGSVYFSVSGKVTGEVQLKLSSDQDTLGYYLLSDPSHIHWFNPQAVDAGDVFSFKPRGDFGLVASNNGKKGNELFFSQDQYDSAFDGSSHFAFFNADVPEPGFDSNVPEPARLGLLGVGLLGLSFILRRRFFAAKN